jgi:PKD repeat protein/KaiC/GvpD/RAD55 family RecA-like ATPase
MAQNYIEFNVTAPYAPGISNFTVTSIVTSLAELLTTIENQSLHVVAKTPPNATFVSSSTTPLTGEDIVFNATNSHDLDGQITDYFWDFGDGNIGTGSIANHAYADNGTYQVTLTVTDNDGLDDTTSDMITVQNRPPIAQFSESATIVDTEVTIYFNASDSYDPDGSIVVYFWDFGDGTNATGLIVTHSYAENGTYVVTLTVTDNDAAKASTNATKTVLNQHPVASFTESAETVYTGETITFNATSSYDSDGFIISYFWDFGDGENTTGVVVDHSYVDNGAYTVTLTVTDEDGDSGIATSVKSIVNRDPVASFIIGPQQPIAGKIVVFNASASYDLDGDIVSYRWDFGDENTTIIASSSITHRYASFGNYTVVLTVIDNDNFYNSSAITIAVHNVDVSIIDVVVPTKNINLGQTVTIVVVVKNEGTTNTTFNVIVSANDTSIETRIIQDLRPSEIRNLNFAWNTSTLTESGTYVVRVETDGIQDETDVADNLNENVRVEMHSHPFNIWGELSSYAMPIGIGLISFLAVVGTILIRRNRQAASPKTLPPKESRVFDELLSDIPDAYSVMVIGDAGSGKSVFCQQLANMYLKQGKSCIYVTYDCFPDEIRENMRTLGWDTSMYEQREAFLFIDCYSSNAGLESKEKHNIQQSFTLSELGIAISATIEDLKQKPVRILLDSTVPLFARLDQAKVVEFLQDRSARIKGENGVFFFVVGKGTLSDDHISRLEEIVDCIVELQVVEENGNIEKRLRIKKLRGRKFAHAWIPFRIASKNGITFLVEKRK